MNRIRLVARLALGLVGIAPGFVAAQGNVATSGADVMRSRDGSRTWETLVQRGRPVGARR